MQYQHQLETCAYINQESSMDAIIYLDLLLDRSLLDLGPNPIGWTPFSPNPQQFELFKELPAELRLKIWKEAMPGLRIIEVFWSEQKSCFVTNCPIPRLLHVCFESRKCALARYKKLEVRSNNKITGSTLR